MIFAQDILRVPGRHVVRLTYTANIEGEPKIDEEHREYKWFTLEELKNMENLDVYFRELLDKAIIA